MQSNFRCHFVSKERSAADELTGFSASARKRLFSYGEYILIFSTNSGKMEKK
jgi:hypothetical protein